MTERVTETQLDAWEDIAVSRGDSKTKMLVAEVRRLRKEDAETRAILLDAFREAKRGDCWCDDSPQHTPLCLQIEAFVGRATK